MDEDATGTSRPVTRNGIGGTIIIRWWHEALSESETDADQALRGTVLDLSGRTLGHFSGTDALLDLVGKFIPRRPPMA